MRTKRIGNVEKNLADVTEDWVVGEIIVQQRRDPGVVVQVTIREGTVFLLLSTPGEHRQKTTDRAPNDREKRIFDLWSSLGLSTAGFQPEAVIKFLKRIPTRF
jgi:hypothetical protein